MRLTLSALCLAALLLGGCAAWRPGQAPQEPGLRVTMTDVVSGEGVATVRGVVASQFDQPVEGLRYVVTIYSTTESGKILDRWQQQVDGTIPAHGSTGMRLQVQSTQFGEKRTTRFGIEAFPVALGGRAVAPPAGWVAAD